MAYGVGRLGSDSRCCRPADPPWDWIDFVDPDHEGVAEIERWLATLLPFVREHELGRVEELMEAAANGMLYASNDALTPIKPIREDPEIFEIRHTALSKKLRFYHGEPTSLPTSLIAVHRHIKTSVSQQQAHVEHAADRYEAGRGSEWESA